MENESQLARDPWKQDTFKEKNWTEWNMEGNFEREQDKEGSFVSIKQYILTKHANWGMTTLACILKIPGPIMLAGRV